MSVREPFWPAPEAAEVETGDGIGSGALLPGRDPGSLPLFAAPARRPGRVRGAFSMRPTGAPAATTKVAAAGEEDVDGAKVTGDRPTTLHRMSARYGGGLDWSLVAAFRQQASDRLSAALGEERAHLSLTAQRERGRAIVAELLAAEATEQVAAGQDAWSLAEQQAMAEAIDAALFGLGRLQPLVDDDRVENIVITGHATVFLELVDGTVIPGPPVADSDQELIDFLVFLASRSEVNARPFSEAQPTLHLRLDGGARLAAAAWVTPRPSVVIRRHRLARVTLEGLVDRHALTEVAASFLAAAVKAGLSIVVAGMPGAGKTTLVRALCAQIPPWEAIGTFETEYELHLHEMPDRHPIVHPFEARPGSGEVGPDGRRAGEFSLDQALSDSWRFNLSRLIVGEVRGRELLAMIEAMQGSRGSISTTHARSGAEVMERLITAATKANVSEQHARRALAQNIDILVQLHLSTVPIGDGAFRRDRWVSEILAVSPGEQDRGYALTQVFRPAPGRPAVAAVLPDELRALTADGFDLGGYLEESQLLAEGHAAEAGRLREATR